LVNWCWLRVAGYELWVAGYELWGAGYGLRVASYGLRVVGCGRRPRGWWGSLRHFDKLSVNQCKQAQDKFFVFSLTIATILYKYMYICLCAAVWQRYQVVLNMEVSSYG